MAISRSMFQSRRPERIRKGGCRTLPRAKPPGVFQQERPSTSMPWRCAFESPLRKGGDLEPGLCDPLPSLRTVWRLYTRPGSLFQAPNGQIIGSPNFCHRQHEHGRGPRVESSPEAPRGQPLPALPASTQRAISYQLPPPPASRFRAKRSTRAVFFQRDTWFCGLGKGRRQTPPRRPSSLAGRRTGTSANIAITSTANRQ